MFIRIGHLSRKEEECDLLIGLQMYRSTWPQKAAFTSILSSRLHSA